MPRTQKTDSAPVLTGFPPKNVVCARCHRRGDPREIVTPCACTDEKYMYLHRECMRYSMFGHTCAHCNTPYKAYTALHSEGYEAALRILLGVVFAHLFFIILLGWIRVPVLRAILTVVPTSVHIAVFIFFTVIFISVDYAETIFGTVTTTGHGDAYHYIDCGSRYILNVPVFPSDPSCDDWTSTVATVVGLVAVAACVVLAVWTALASHVRMEKARALKCNYKETPKEPQAL